MIARTPFLLLILLLISAIVAGGVNICVFTTGRGMLTGSAIVPTIKIIKI